MENTIKLNLVRGTLDVMILRIVAVTPMHGWGISLRIQELSQNVIQVNQGSLFPCLHRLASQGAISAKWGKSENGRRAKFYHLTPKGRIRLAQEVKNWERMSTAIVRVLGGREDH